MPKFARLFGAILTLLVLLPITSFATQAPYDEEVAQQFATLTRKSVNVVYDVSGNTSLGSSTTNSGIHPLGVTLPAGAIVTNSAIYIKTLFVDAGNNGNAAKVKFYCSQDGDIKEPTDLTLTNANAFIMGASGGSTVAYRRMASSCTVTAVNTADDYSAGKANIIIDYFVGQ